MTNGGNDRAANPASEVLIQRRGTQESNLTLRFWRPSRTRVPPSVCRPKSRQVTRRVTENLATYNGGPRHRVVPACMPTPCLHATSSSSAPIRVAAVANGGNPDSLGVVIDQVENGIGASACRPRRRERCIQRLADPSRILQHRPRDEHVRRPGGPRASSSRWRCWGPAPRPAPLLAPTVRPRPRARPRRAHLRPVTAQRRARHGLATTSASHRQTVVPEILQIAWFSRASAFDADRPPATPARWCRSPNAPAAPLRRGR